MPAKYMTIVQYITDSITSNKFKISEKLPSEEELMKQFNVSRIVVSNAMRIVSGTGLIKRIPGKGTFVISNNIKENESKPIQPVNGFYNVALIIHRIFDDYSVRLVESIITYAYTHNVIISIFCSQNDAMREELLIKSIMSSNYHGIILFPSDQAFYSNSLLEAKNKQFPIALIDRNLERLECSCIQTDNVLGARMAVSELLGLGHKKIAFLTSSPMSATSVTHRLDGYLWQLRKNNIMLDPSLILTNLSTDNFERLDEIINNQSATAFLCVNGADYEFLIDRISKAHKSVPKDFSVITFDKPGTYNVQENDSLFTYIQQDVNKIAEFVVDIMKKMVCENIALKENIMIPPNLIKGKSTRKIN